MSEMLDMIRTLGDQIRWARDLAVPDLPANKRFSSAAWAVPG